MKPPLFNRAIRILLTTNALILFAAAMFGPITAIFVEKVGGDLLDASYAGTIFALSAGFMTLLSGKYSDKIKENELIVVFGYLLIGLGFFLYTLVDSIIFLLFVQVIIGFGEAIYSPAFDAAYSKHLNVHRAGREWGAWESINYFTLGTGAFAGGLITNFFGFDALFITMGALCLISAMYIYLLPRSVI
ncbi:MFS transporter [Candidatus Peregrinibacteria bacterium]|nr:MFS transporter [Candidatus Peregrinibacteria bacterium]